MQHVVRGLAVADHRLAPGQSGGLTQVVPFDMVDAAVARTGAVQARALPSRVVVDLLPAGTLFAESSDRRCAPAGVRWATRYLRTRLQTPHR